MTDVNITQNTNQQDQTPKKTFFGGEVNFQDNNTFETLDQGPTEFSQLQTETTNENTAQLTQLQEDIQETDLEDFDPFEEDNKEEDNKEKDDENNGVINKEEDSKEKDNKNNSVINKEEDNKEKDDKNNGVINKEENKNGPVNHPKDNEETHPENEKEIPLDTPSPKKEVVEEEFEETPEEYEQEPEIKTTGDEVIDKFLQLSHTAREIFQLAEDKSHFKIL